jgi:acyl dehydratase
VSGGGPRPLDGPWFEDLAVGDVFDGAPSLTLTSGLAAAHQAVTGDRLRLPLDHHLCREVTGLPAPLAHPALVWDVAVGQSTPVTRMVVANLFYRGLSFDRAPAIGDTLTTTTEVVALRQNRPRPGRAATGLAALRITTVDQERRPVLAFWRCAMLPLRDPLRLTGHDDDLDLVGAGDAEPPQERATSGWRLDRFREAVPGTHFDGIEAGASWAVDGGDVVSSAPELARLTLNVARVHHDGSAGEGGRLVYGGHTIALALAQATRVLPNLVTVVAWRSCDHLGPVREGDTLSSVVSVERARPLPGGGGLVDLRSRVRACQPGDEARDVLDWRFVAAMA